MRAWISTTAHLERSTEKKLRRMDEETKKDGGVVDWNYILNDFM